MKSRFLLFFVWCMFCGTTLSARSQTPEATPRDVSLPSDAPSGNAVNDQVLFRYHALAPLPGQKTPAVVLLHHSGGSGDDRRITQFAHALNRRGIAAVALTLPYHGRRRAPNQTPQRPFTASADSVRQAFEQSVSDVGTVVTWLRQQPEVDANRIGAVGVSLGAFVLHLAMGRDARIRAGVAALGAGNVGEIFLHMRGRKDSEALRTMETLRSVEPLTYADRNRPRRVLMIQAARDTVVPPHYAERLWEALGRPPIQWADVNHVGLALTLNSAIKTTIAYLETAWSETPDDLSGVPHVRAVTLKAGLISGLDTTVTPALQYQFFSVGRRDHRGLLHANAGVGLRGPFVSVAATINRHVDVGVGRRVLGNNIGAYASFHRVF
jgi:dienelactone hydrolase